MKKNIRQYSDQIKLIIISNSTYIKKRLSIFPKSLISKINRMKLDGEIEVKGKSYTRNELIKEVLIKYKSLHRESFTSSYNNIRHSFIREAKQNKDNVQDVYEKYRSMLTERLKNDKSDLYFCLDALKLVEKSLKK